MKAEDAKVGAPTWMLFGSRPSGPFVLVSLGHDHAVLSVPVDTRLWSHIESVSDSNPSGKPNIQEIVPLSVLTQDSEEVEAWRERNYPKVGDLVIAKSRKWYNDFHQSFQMMEEGVVMRTTKHRVVLMNPDCPGQEGRMLTKDSVIVLVKGQQG